MAQVAWCARHTFPALLFVCFFAFPASSRAQTIEWIRQFGSSENYNGGRAVAVCPGGVCIAGSAGGELPGDSNYAGGFYDAFTRKYDSSGAVQWTRLLGTEWMDSTAGIAADATGVYVAGFTEGSLPGQSFSPG